MLLREYATKRSFVTFLHYLGIHECKRRKLCLLNLFQWRSSIEIEIDIAHADRKNHVCPASRIRSLHCTTSRMPLEPKISTLSLNKLNCHVTSSWTSTKLTFTSTHVEIRIPSHSASCNELNSWLCQKPPVAWCISLLARQSERDFSTVGHTITDAHLLLSPLSVEAVQMVCIGLRENLVNAVDWRVTVVTW